MNYIKHINMFFEMATGEGLSLKALGLYMVLLDKWNKLKFIETFKMTNSIIMSITNCSLHELRTARKELEEKKYIIYEKGKIGQAGTYKIINLEKEKIKKDKKSSEKSSIDFSLVENNIKKSSTDISLLYDDIKKSSEQNGVNISLVDKKSSEKNDHFLYTLYKQTNNNKQTKKDIYIYNTREKKLNNELDNINNNNSLTKEANKNKEFGLSKEKNTEIKLEIGKEKKDKINKEKKKKYKESIYLTDAEYNKIIELYKQENIDINKGIDILDTYKMSIGKKYKSDYHVMIGWVKTRLIEDKNKELNNTNKYNKNKIAERQQREWQDFTNTISENWMN